MSRLSPTYFRQAEGMDPTQLYALLTDLRRKKMLSANIESEGYYHRADSRIDSFNRWW